jgi:putative cell wall-binding protein
MIGRASGARARRRKAWAVAAALVASSATIWASRASTNFAFTRLAGADRYDTARVIAERTFGTSSGVMLATGERFPDALAGAYAAGLAGGPILLTTSNSLTPTTATALHDLQTAKIAILGGPQAVSAAVENDLVARGYQVVRLGGVDRYDTARIIAEFAGTDFIGTIGGRRVALVAGGEDPHFPDALSGSPMADAQHYPTLLTKTATLSDAARRGLSDLGIGDVFVLGGPAAVSDNVVAQIQGMGITVQRLGGKDRTDTAVQVANFERDNLQFSTSHVELARGDLFPDSLSGGPHAGHERAPVLLTEDPGTLGPYTSNWLAGHAGPLADGHIFGGDEAITPSTQSQAESIVRTNSLTSSSTTTTSGGGGGSPPPPMRFVGATATGGSQMITVTFSQDALCQTVDSNGSDFTASVKNPHTNVTVTTAVVGASCPDILDQTVGLTLPQSAGIASGDIVTVVAQKGGDGDTVDDALLEAQPVGDSVSASAS